MAVEGNPFECPFADMLEHLSARHIKKLSGNAMSAVSVGEITAYVLSNLEVVRLTKPPPLRRWTAMSFDGGLGTKKLINVVAKRRIDQAFDHLDQNQKNAKLSRRAGDPDPGSSSTASVWIAKKPAAAKIPKKPAAAKIPNRARGSAACLASDDEI